MWVDINRKLCVHTLDGDSFLIIDQVTFNFLLFITHMTIFSGEIHTKS